MFGYEVLWTAFLGIYTLPLLRLFSPSQLIKHCGSFPSASWVFALFCFLFVVVLERVFWVRNNFVFKALTNRRGCSSGTFGVCVCVCVCTYKFCATSFLRSNASKSKLLKSEVAKLSPTDVCFSTQCRVSFMKAEQISHQVPGVWQQGTEELAKCMWSYTNDKHFLSRHFVQCCYLVFNSCKDCLECTLSSEVLTLKSIGIPCW